MSFSTHKFGEKLSIRISTTFGFRKLLMISYVLLNSEEIFHFLTNASNIFQGYDMSFCENIYMDIVYLIVNTYLLNCVYLPFNLF